MGDFLATNLLGSKIIYQHNGFFKA